MIRNSLILFQFPDVGTTILPEDKDNTENDKLNVPAVVSAVVGGVLVIVVAVVIALFIIRRRGRIR